MPKTKPSKKKEPEVKKSWDPIFEARHSMYKDGPFDPFHALSKANKSQDDF